MAARLKTPVFTIRPDRAWVARCVAEPWLKIYYHVQDLDSVDSRQVKLKQITKSR